jgi:pyruvate decarboxylase
MAATYTVGDYLAERLAGIGIRHHFVVPGDYNLVLLDKLQAHPRLTEVGCANELNCSLAAEGYARKKGVAACVVTYSVGAISAFNGTGSAYAENLPLILISGSPNTNDDAQFHLLHHTLGEHDFTYQMDMAKRITCCAVAVRRAHDAPHQIDKAIRTALQTRKPAYIEIPTNLSGTPCVRPGPISSVLYSVPSDTAVVESAVARAHEFIQSKLKPIILVGPKLGRAGAEKELLAFAEALGCAVAVQPAAKGLFPEDHKQYIGIYWGQISNPATSAIVSWSDGILCLGCVFTDYATVGWTALRQTPLLQANMEHVNMPGYWFHCVHLKDFLNGLTALILNVYKNDATVIEYERLRPDIVPSPSPLSDTKLMRKEVNNQVQALLDKDTTLFAETGDSWFNGINMKLPRGAKFEIEMQWGHIGWSVPAAFGYAMADRSRKVVVLLGDGSFQVTAQEVSQMIRWRLPIIMVLINNRGYTIEVEIHDGPYNKIKNWDYAAVIEAFNAEDGAGLGLHAKTAGEFKECLDKAQEHTDGPTLIECAIDQDDCSQELITWGHLVAAANARPPAPIASI